MLDTVSLLPHRSVGTVADPAYAALGAPGAGKGTVCKWLSKKHGWGHLESGERFRAIMRNAPDSPLAQFLRQYVPAGELVPDDVVMEQAEGWLEEDLRLFDGIPRTDGQCTRFDELLLRKRGLVIKRALYINVTRPELKERLRFRKVCTRCGTVWNDLTNPPPRERPNCCGKLEPRSDDTPLLVDRRQDIFEALYGPVIDYYRSQGKLVEIPYTNDMTLDQLFAAVCAAL